MTFPLRYLHVTNSDRIYLTQHTLNWLKHRYQLCYGVPFKLTRPLTVEDLPELKRLINAVQDKVISQ